MDSLINLPKNLPVPEDDGACDHLTGHTLPDIFLPSTKDGQVNLFQLGGWVVIYIYPMIGRPDAALPDGWNQIPGARGCTPQSCSFRDHYRAFQSFDATVFGLSTQTTEDQKEAAERLHLPFALLSDAQLHFVRTMSLPVFQVENRVFSKRLTLICHNSEIIRVFYPVFPPDKNVNEVIHYLNEVC